MNDELKQHAVDIYNCMSNVPKTEEGGEVVLKYIEDKLIAVKAIGMIEAYDEISIAVTDDLRE